ncbi:MAG: response regulator [Nitrospirae bacterium]|jgi:two-component system phosphate regulon response regulator PhoB|nr:response regulator [Nitrospirota bacterium]
MSKRVLIVDDDSKSRRVFEAILISMGFETVLANDGDEALEILAGDPYFDLIITDVMMPYMTGFEFSKKLKEYTETKDIPVIATSAFDDWKKAREEHDLIADGFVAKPIDRETLRKEITRILG